MTSARLTIVGTGIRFGAQTTPEATATIERADEVLYLVADGPTALWVESLNSSARSLIGIYERGRSEGAPRSEIYDAMVDEILATLRRVDHLCVVFYGHPGVFVSPSHDAIERARAEGFEAHMLPGISAEDCLFADLGIDPGEHGCQSYEATRFITHPREVDTSTPLILWQIGAIGRPATVEGPPSRRMIEILVSSLRRFYPADHEVTVYEASPYVINPPTIRTVRLDALPDIEIKILSTLLVPASTAADPDPAMISRIEEAAAS